ncbi:hypothetical protein Pint_22744 [Pistacia integerrima]|uniref:Uncharacterized protein n=1 Tax=Pistacia integerrima TaxID=434235 RepID=A0ACC0YNF9_9ROSI|nr:hypothetical protein Pint_22744 [Pistacia integerrima]
MLPPKVQNHNTHSPLTAYTHPFIHIINICTSISTKIPNKRKICTPSQTLRLTLIHLSTLSTFALQYLLRYQTNAKYALHHQTLKNKKANKRFLCTPSKYT